LNICLMVSFGVTSTTHEVHCKLADVWIFWTRKVHTRRLQTANFAG
jgi:hypothetical protein